MPEPGTYDLSLQYHSQVPLEVLYEGAVIAELPASLDGMYLSGAGRGAYWPAGEISADEVVPTITVRATEPNGLADALGARRLVWLGNLAATQGSLGTVPLRSACGRYVDHYAYAKRGGGG